MSIYTPIPRSGQRAWTEISALTSPREPDALGHLWKGSRSLTSRSEAHSDSGGTISRAIQRRVPQAGSLPTLLYPFCIYQLPWQYRTGANFVSSAFTTYTGLNWLKVRVRTGRILASGQPIHTVTGTDGAAVPEVETYNDDDTYFDIQVPASTALFYIWVRYDASGAQLYFGTDAASAYIPSSTHPYQTAQADTDWDNFPQTDSKHVVIGIVDSDTFGDQQRLLITQYVRQDILGTGGGGTSTSLAPYYLYRNFANYMVCCNFVNTNVLNNANLIQVAKPYKLNNAIASEYIYGTKVNYSYPHTNASNTDPNSTLYGVFRQAFIGSNYENQGVVPQYISLFNSNNSHNLITITQSDVIWAMSGVNTRTFTEAADNSTANNSAITYIDINADGRAWAAFANQNFGG